MHTSIFTFILVYRVPSILIPDPRLSLFSLFTFVYCLPNPCAHPYCALFRQISLRHFDATVGSGGGLGVGVVTSSDSTSFLNSSPTTLINPSLDNANSACWIFLVGNGAKMHNNVTGTYSHTIARQVASFSNFCTCSLRFRIVERKPTHEMLVFFLLPILFFIAELGLQILVRVCVFRVLYNILIGRSDYYTRGSGSAHNRMASQ